MGHLTERRTVMLGLGLGLGFPASGAAAAQAPPAVVPPGLRAPVATHVIEQDAVRLEHATVVPDNHVAFALGQAVYARIVVSRYLRRPGPAVLNVMLVDEERIPYTDPERRIWVPYGRLRNREPGSDPLTLVHETTHVFATGRDRALTEGLAVHVQTLLGPRSYPNFGHDLHQLTVDLQAAYGREIPYAESESVRLARDSGPGRALAYVQEGSFSRWLIETEGLEKYLRLLDGEAPSALYNRDLRALEVSWRAVLRQLTPRPITPRA